MSIAGGLHNAFERGTEVGCDCMQVFVKNQRQWKAPPLTDEAVRLWHATATETPIGPVIAHDSYLINLGSPDEAGWRRSIDAFVDELERCERLAIPGLVMHPGSHLGEGETWCLKRIARALDTIHGRTRGFSVRTLLETTAGQGTSVGYRFEHLGGIIARVKAPERLALCVDTCHVFAAGYDLTTEAGYAETMAALDEQVGPDRIACFHLNDSKRPLGSRVDRHEHIGKGRLGSAAFRRLVTDERFLGLPMILETPKGEDDRGRDFDKLALARLRRMARVP
jgi:deoxyribonuclease-4